MTATSARASMSQTQWNWLTILAGIYVALCAAAGIIAGIGVPIFAFAAVLKFALGYVHLNF